MLVGHIVTFKTKLIQSWGFVMNPIQLNSKLGMTFLTTKTTTTTSTTTTTTTTSTTNRVAKSQYPGI